MILDTLMQGWRYRAIHAGFAEAFEFLAGPLVQSLPPGRHDLDGDRLYVSIGQEDGRGRAGARLEAHRRYIDIQVTLEGAEEIGWAALAACVIPDGAFLTDRDVGFFADRPQTWFSLPPGHFAIFFPDDAHAPLAGHGPLKKAIVKVLV
jgi:YhcH/YjgK/YiaL family protein